MIAKAVFTGIISNQLRVRYDDSSQASVLVRLVVKKANKQENIFFFTIYNSEALNFKERAAQGDLIYIDAEPYSVPNKHEEGKYISGYRIVSYEILKKKEMD